VYINSYIETIKRAIPASDTNGFT